VKRLALFVLLSSSASAAAAPSFDCDKAATEVEQAICSDQNPELAARDAALARLYRALKEQGGHDAVLGGQSAWLGKRDACGADAACLASRYDERIAVLAREAGDEAGVTGSYGYQLSQDTDTGDAFMVREADGSLSGMISTVSGPTYHLCNVEFAGAAAFGDAWIWDGPADEAGFDGRACRILFRFDEGQLRVDSQSCNYYCGARGFFDATYERTR